MLGFNSFLFIFFINLYYLVIPINTLIIKRYIKNCHNYKANIGCDYYIDKDLYVYDYNDDGSNEIVVSSNGELLNPMFTYAFTHVSFSPVYEPCSEKILFNRKKLFFANNFTHYIQLSGQTPESWVMRWHAPFERCVH